MPIKNENRSIYKRKKKAQQHSQWWVRVKKDLNVMLNQMTQLRGKNRWQGSWLKDTLWITTTDEIKNGILECVSKSLNYLSNDQEKRLILLN